MKSKINNKGFTLIELVLTISVLGIMAGMYTGIADFTSSDLDRSVRRLESDLRYAQQLSTAEEINYGFRNLDANTYEIYRLTPGVQATDPHTNQNLVVDYDQDYGGVAFQGNYQVEFDTMGRPVIGGGSQIVLMLGNQTKTITVLNQTGYIQVP